VQTCSHGAVELTSNLDSARLRSRPPVDAENAFGCAISVWEFASVLGVGELARRS